MMDRAVTALLFALLGAVLCILAVRLAMPTGDGVAQQRRLSCSERCERWGMRKVEVQYHEVSGPYHVDGARDIVCVCRTNDGDER
jgi:hypothetical protein